MLLGEARVSFRKEARTFFPKIDFLHCLALYAWELEDFQGDYFNEFLFFQGGKVEATVFEEGVGVAIVY